MRSIDGRRLLPLLALLHRCAPARWARDFDAWCGREIAPLEGQEDEDLDGTCREIVRRLGAGGWLWHAVALDSTPLDVRSLCLIRETLGRHSGIADFAFALQGLGSGPISLFGSEAMHRAWLPRVATGEAIPAFALSEAEAGSDVAAMTTAARREGDDWLIDGEKTWISNAGLADFYVVFCRLPEAETKVSDASSSRRPIPACKSPRASTCWRRIRWERSGFRIAGCRRRR